MNIDLGRFETFTKVRGRIPMDETHPEVTVQGSGRMVLNAPALELLGVEPDEEGTSFLFLVDREARMIGLKHVEPTDPNAYRAVKSGRRWQVSASRFLDYAGVDYKETGDLTFTPEVDTEHGLLYFALPQEGAPARSEMRETEDDVTPATSGEVTPEPETQAAEQPRKRGRPRKLNSSSSYMSR